MKIFPLLLLIALSAIAAAELPKPAPITRYSGLWTNSPFTTKPVIDSGPAEVNPFEDYALGGVSPIPGGYRVTLFNKKNPEERIVLPDDTQFKVLSVQYGAGNPLATTVSLASGAKTGTVTFDEKLLTLKSAPAPQQPQQQLPQPNGQPMPPGVPGQPGQPGIPGQTGDAPRQPRPRVVPPSAPGGAQAAPQQPTQPQQNNAGQRPRINRR